MRCPRCGFDSPVATTFCGGCGSRLATLCAACGTANPPSFAFCGSCGSPLGATPGGAAGGGASPPTPEGPAARPAERRQLTVMFCDLVGSTSLSALLDPEELRELVRAYQSTAAAVIERYDGYIAQYLGDGILAYFGYPTALENEAGRAVRAARELVGAIRRLNQSLERPVDVSLSARVGIHTGVVVVGEIGGGSRRENLALGETPNVAARIQAAADPDEVVLSADTYRLVRSEFRCASLGALAIRGLSEPMEIYRAEDELTVLHAPAAGSGGPVLIGRDEELALLELHWTRASGGKGEIVLIGADAGLGKSALVHAFASRARASGGSVLGGRCLPYFRTSPLQPVAELLRRWVAASDDGTGDSPRAALRQLLTRYGVEEALPLLASLLGLRSREREALAPPAEPQWRERTAAAVNDLILRAANDRPMLLCIEDLHWADPSTLELLAALVERAADHPLLLLLTHRPDFQIPWGAPRHQSELPLPRLSAAEVAEMISTLTGGMPLPDEVATRIIDRTDGVPLFVEELTRSVLESGLLEVKAGSYELIEGELPPLAIPLTLHDSLEARLERLSATRELAQLAAVLGREFSYDLIRAVADVDDDTLSVSLAQLVAADLLMRTESAQGTAYAFKHALIQEVAYQSMLRGERQTHHLRIGQTLEAEFPEMAATHPELVAQHYTGAGLRERAVELWGRAGRRALERSANREAIVHLRQGLELLDGLPEGAERDARELALLLTLGPALIATLGHAADEVRETYEKAHVLARDDTDPEQRFEILTGLVTTCFVRMEMPEARRAAQEMLQLARAEANPGREAAAEIALGTALIGGGGLEIGLARLEEGIARYQPARDFALAHSAGQDFGVLGMAYSAYALCALGQPLRASERIAEAIRLARSLQHPHTLAIALVFASSVAYFRREPALAEEPLRELAELAGKERFEHFLLGTAPFEAWMRAERGERDAALERLLHAGTAAGGLNRRADIQIVFWRSIAGEVYLRVGRPDEALILLDEVVACIRGRPTRLWWLGEAHRLRARALAALGRGMEADAELARAISESSAAGAKLFELRARVDRAHLMSRAGLSGRDREAIAGLYATFREGHELDDLRLARELIVAPASPARRAD